MKTQELKLIIGTILVALFALVSTYLNIAQQTSCQTIVTTVEQPKSRVKLVANIIAREGSLSYRTAEKYATWVFDSADRHDVDPVLILAVMKVESTFDKSATNKGAIGLMQVVHYWHKEKSTKQELFDPQKNIDVGARILKEYSRRNKTEYKTLLAYNASTTKVQYANKVLKYKTKYQKELA